LLRDYLLVSNGLVHSLAGTGDATRALALSEKNLVLASAAARARPNDPDTLGILMSAKSTAADLLNSESKFEESIPLRQNVLDLQRRIVELMPGDARARANLAYAHKKLGAIYGVVKRYAQGRAEYEQARVIDEEYLRNVGGGRAQLDLSYDYSDLGWVTMRLNDLPGALAFYRKALDLRQSAAAADPNDNRARVSVASSTERIGGLLHRMGKLPEALQETQQAIVLWKALADRPGSAWTTTRDLADTHEELGDVYVSMRAYPRAAAEYDMATGLYKSLSDRGVLPKSLYTKIDQLKTQAEKCRHSTCVVDP
jgi:tetratricopeptide (TPR) repeat protein